MGNKINILTFSYLILSYYVLIVQLKNLKKLVESGESKNAATIGTVISSVRTTTPDENDIRDLDWDVWCKLQPNGNNCSGRNIQITRFYYDTFLEDCKTFYYNRCTSSFNNFDTLSECHESCTESGLKPVGIKELSYKVLCRLQPSFGTGYEYHPSFYFDINQKRCRGFSYSGKGGNGNRFPSSQICSATCLRLMESEVIV